MKFYRLRDYSVLKKIIISNCNCNQRRLKLTTYGNVDGKFKAGYSSLDVNINTPIR